MRHGLQPGWKDTTGRSDSLAYLSGGDSIPQVAGIAVALGVAAMTTAMATAQSPSQGKK
jgi:hypothetical protein